MAGNRLSGQGWEGWSSSFENDSAKNFTRKNSAEDEKLKSFGSLLQKYGHNGVAENEECLFDESKNRPALSTIIAQSCSDGENEVNLLFVTQSGSDGENEVNLLFVTQSGSDVENEVNLLFVTQSGSDGKNKINVLFVTQSGSDEKN